MRCALSQSLDVRAARQELKILAGRRVTAGVLLPSNPVASATLMARIPAPSDTHGTTLNWEVTLSQEIEIAGQRSARVATVDAETRAQLQRVAAAEQEIGSQALRAYFEVLATRQARALFSEVAQLASALSVFAEERAKESLMAPVDADLLRAEATRVNLLSLDAQRREGLAKLAFATTLGLDPTTTIELPAELEAELAAPHPQPVEQLTANALRVRGEIGAAALERQVFEKQVSLLRRARVPNLTISAFAARDEFDQQLYGGGLSMPFPLPAPLGRTNKGETAETRARIERAETTIEQVQRRVRLEVAQAYLNEHTRADALKTFAPDLMTRAHADLAALREGLASRQLSVRDALLAQRSLVELLLARVDAQLAYAQASVDLDRAAGILVGGAQ